jgi:hypothetical protein
MDEEQYYRLNLILNDEDRDWLKFVANLKTNGNMSAAARYIFDLSRKRRKSLGLVLPKKEEKNATI